MSGLLIVILSGLRLSSLQYHNHTIDDVYFDMPRFWTNTGFCPTGNIHHKEITSALLSDAVQMNLRHIAALPTGALTHLRIHWLLEMVQFIQFTQTGIPVYDFSHLDTFLMNLDDMGLKPVVEFMANPGNVFLKNPTRNALLWEDFSFQVTKHYLNVLGAAKVTHWRYESWNEPDLANYNRLNFTVEDYLTYVESIRKGLTAAGLRAANSLHFPLRGPAGLFKSQTKHPLCWSILEKCNADLLRCPFETLTYHRKGDGTAEEVMAASILLLEDIHKRFPALKDVPISNDEADPIAGWSTPRDFQQDVRYATELVLIVFSHWRAKLEDDDFKTLESISHDNAFLSYYPHEFSQRTLLAHFRMNNTNPPHSQFIQKPVYGALGMLSQLGPLAANVELLRDSGGAEIQLLKSTVPNEEPLYMSWILACPAHDIKAAPNTFSWLRQLPFELCESEAFGYIVELLAPNRTDPAAVWRSYNSPAYPNATMRAAMRLSQTPALLATGLLARPELEIELASVMKPWVMHIRVCSNLMKPLKRALNLAVVEVTLQEVLLTWREPSNATNCLKTYEVWFRPSDGTGQDWICVTNGWHLPFPSFQFAPLDGAVNGFYKVRGVDIFDGKSPFSEIVEYIEW